MDTNHSIQIRVDASQAKQGLNELRQAVNATNRDLRSLGSGSNAFGALASQLSATSSAFQNLSRSIASASAAANRIANVSSSSFSVLSREARGATSSLGDLYKAFSVSRQAAEILGATVGAISLASLAKGAQNAGNNLLSFRIAIDSVASSSRESGDALRFIQDTATNIGTPLDAATDSFKMLYSSMRALGRNPDEIIKVFRGFSVAMSALHVTAADQRMAWREIAETYSQGIIHTRQAILSLGSHIPAMASNLQTALGVSGDKLHEMFKAGGLPLDTWTKVSELLERRYGSGLAEAANHSTLNIIALQNALTRLQQSVYEGGFDSGFTTFLKSLQSGLNTLGVDNIGKSIGEAFRGAFTALALLTDKVIAARGPIIEVGQALATYALATTGIRLVAGSFALLLSPLGALAALASLAQSEWLNLSGVFAGSDAAFNSGAERIKKLTNGFIDLRRSMKGAVEVWELAKGLFDGKSLADSKALAAQAGAAFDAGEYGRGKGQEFANGFTERAAALFGKLGDALKLPSFDLASFRKEWDKLYKDSAPKPFQGAGDYAGNAQQYFKVNNDLSESLKKVYERLSPANKALVEYRENLEAIGKMAGKLSPSTGQIINDSELDQLRQAARERALTEGFPAASRIQALMDSVKMESEALRNLNGNTSGEAIKQEREFLTFKYEMLKKHIALTGEEERAIRALIAARAQLERGGANGFSRWANEQKSAFEGMQDNIKSGLDSIADGFTKIVTEGKGKFKNLGEAIRAELRSVFGDIARNFIRTGIRSLMADGLKGLNLSSLFGDNGLKANIGKALGLGQGVLDKANASIDDAAKAIAETTTPLMNVQASVVNLNGASFQGLGATGTEAFRPATDIGKAVKPESLGGVSPKAMNDNLSGRGQSLHHLPELIGVKPLTDSGPLRMSTRAGTDMIHVDAKLKDILANASKALPPGWRGQFISGYRHTGAINPNSLHDRGLATDVQLFDAGGKALGNYQNASTFRDYEKFAQAAKRYQMQRYPELNDKFAWGGYYGGRGGPFGYGGADTMHFDLGGKRGRMGNWEHGLTAGRGIYDTPSNPSKGMNLSKIDPTPTGSIQKLADESKRAQQAFESQVSAVKKVEEETRKATQAAASFANPVANMDTGVTKLAGSLSQSVPATEGFTSEIQKLIQKLLGGGDGLLSGLGSIAGGLFAEGGYSDSAVSSAAMPASFWSGAPHFAEGTPNTSGGMPAILHDNEAVVPLSRGRSIPVDLNGVGAGGGDTHIHNNISTNVVAKDFDSFRRSRGQLMTGMHLQTARLAARNG